MGKLIIVALSLAAFAVSMSAQNKSVYTSTTEKACKAKKVADEHGGDYVGICPGVGGYKLELIEGDLRQTLNVITPAKTTHQLNFTSFYGSFSAIDRKIEWRLKRGVPVALIARYNVADPENSEKRTSYLMVAKIGRAESCVTDVVLPGKNQNLTARRLADAAPTKPCKKGE